MPRFVQPRPYDSDVHPRLFGWVASKPRVSIRVLAQLLGALGFVSISAFAQTQAVANPQLPTGGQVNAGQATISQSGSTLNVNQTSQRAVVDWNTFKPAPKLMLPAWTTIGPAIVVLLPIVTVSVWAVVPMYLQMVNEKPPGK